MLIKASYVTLLSALLLVLAHRTVYGQAAKSPFSYAGMGEHYGNALISNQGMAGIGVSQPQYFFLNNVNPALLIYNGKMTVFEAGVVGESRKVQGDTSSQRSTDGNLNYLAVGFPVWLDPSTPTSRWTTAMGLMPYTSVNYKLEYNDSPEGSMASSVDGQVTEQGSGGLSQFYWANGFRINHDFSVGLRANYLFGSTQYDYLNRVDLGQITTYSIGVSEQTYVTDFTFAGGLAFSHDSLFQKNYVVSAGLVYSFGSDLSARRTSVFQRQDNQGFPVAADTLTTRYGTIYLPPSVTAGLSISKGYTWSVSVEFSTQDWSRFKNLDKAATNLNRSWRAALGTEFTPDPYSIQNYLQRVTYRAGLSLEKSLFLANNADVNDFGINFGFSFPVKRSSLDLAFKFGKRGTASSNALEEQYVKIYFGLTINDQWFIKRRLD